MAFDISSLIKGGASGILEGVEKVISRWVPSPEEKAKAIQELTDSTNSHIEKMAALAQDGINSQLKAKQDELDAAVFFIVIVKEKSFVELRKLNNDWIYKPTAATPKF